MIGDDLERGWRLAESRGPSGPDRLEADPLHILVNGSPLMVGVDHSGARHLLIPIPSDATVPTDSSGPVVALRKRLLLEDGKETVYADLSCSRPDLFDEFAVLSRDVIRAVNSDNSDAARLVAQVLGSWRDLLRAFSPARLDRSEVIGLYGELLILDQLQQLDSRKAAEAWTGATGGRYDFQRGAVVLEVKASTARRGRPFVVHGLDQLERPQNGTLYLWWVHLEVGIDRGLALRSLVKRVLDGSLNRAGLEQKLRNLGYAFDQEDLYESPLLNELERRLYRVDDSFPALTRLNLVGGDLPRGVTAVSYEVDLSGDTPAPVASEEELTVLRTLAGLS